MNSYEEFHKCIHTLDAWYHRASTKEQDTIVNALREFIFNFSTVLRCSDPTNLKHCQQIDILETEFEDLLKD